MTTTFQSICVGLLISFASVPLIATAAGSEDKTVRLWNAATGNERKSLTGHNNMVWCLAFSPGGKTLVLAESCWNLLVNRSILMEIPSKV